MRALEFATQKFPNSIGGGAPSVSLRLGEKYSMVHVFEYYSYSCTCTCSRCSSSIGWAPGSEWILHGCDFGCDSDVISDVKIYVQILHGCELDVMRVERILHGCELDVCESHRSLPNS